VFCAASAGGLWYPDRVATFSSVAVVMAGLLFLVAMAQSSSLRRLVIGPRGIEAELAEVKEGLVASRRAIARQQKLINAFTVYSLAEAIYRDMLLEIAHNGMVEWHQTQEQMRWLTFLFDHGLIQADESVNWIPFEEIPDGEDLAARFKPTPAAELLIRLRGGTKKS
jgi:hypothetical protein